VTTRRTHVCDDLGERYVGPHPGDPDERDPGFCCCGLGLDAYVHTDSTRYVATPLTADVWQDLRGGPS
jgi:hypothetical protein